MGRSKKILLVSIQGVQCGRVRKFKEGTPDHVCHLNLQDLDPKICSNCVWLERVKMTDKQGTQMRQVELTDEQYDQINLKEVGGVTNERLH